MSERSHVTSFEAIEAFRAHLVVFLSKARPTIEEVGNELTRIRVWLETDQRNHWERELRILARQLEQAQQELFVARLSKLATSSAMQEMRVQRLRRQFREAEEKQQITRRWSRQLEERANPMVKEINSLQSFLVLDMVKAVTYLDQVIKSLEAYANVGPGDPDSSSSRPGSSANTSSQPAPPKPGNGAAGEPS